MKLPTLLLAVASSTSSLALAAEKPHLVPAKDAPALITCVSRGVPVFNIELRPRAAKDQPNLEFASPGQVHLSLHKPIQIVAGKWDGLTWFSVKPADDIFVDVLVPKDSWGDSAYGNLGYKGQVQDLSCKIEKDA